MQPSSTVGTPGRFCNHLIRNLALHCIAQHNDLQTVYSYADEMKRLGLELFCGTRRYRHTHVCSEQDAIDYSMGRKAASKTIDLRYTYCQSPEFADTIYAMLRNEPFQSALRAANPHAARIGANTSVFVHVRLGDAAWLNPGFDYYATCLKALKYEDGFLATDSPEDPLCQRLCDEFGLKIYVGDEVDTLQFGSTCAHCVLSNGTFSWMIGVLGHHTTVYYPRARRQWHGDIFNMPGWLEMVV
jgi:hypothetical protein